MDDTKLDQQLNHLKSSYENLPNATTTEGIMNVIKQKEDVSALPSKSKQRKSTWFHMSYVASIVGVLFIVLVLGKQHWLGFGSAPSDNHTIPSQQATHHNDHPKSQAYQASQNPYLINKTDELNRLLSSKETKFMQKMSMGQDYTTLKSLPFDQKAQSVVTSFRQGNYASKNEIDQAYEKARNDINFLFMSPEEAIAFLKNNQNRLSETERTQDAMSLLNKMKALEKAIPLQIPNNKLNNALVLLPEMNDKKPFPKGTDPILKERASFFTSNGFRFYDSGLGTLDIMIDYTKLQKELHLPAKVNAYVNIEKRFPDISRDAGLIIPWNDLGSLVVDIEKFLIQYPDFAKNDELYKHYKQYLNMYLFGLVNTPAFDRQTKKLKSDVNTSYQWFLKKYPNTKTYSIVEDYYKLLKSNHFTKTDQVAHFQIKYPIF